MTTPRVIPTDSTTSFWSQRATLSGINYVFTFRYQQRSNHFVVDLAIDDGTLLASGVPVVCGWQLFSRWAWDTRMPPGAIIAVSKSTNTDPPDIGELGENARCVLVYYDPI